MAKLGEHTFSRTKVSTYSLILGLLIGIYNSISPPIDFILSPALFALLAAAIISVIVLHEGVHGTVAATFGFNPIFGIKPPLVYVTFKERIPRGQFIVITLAPLVILDTVFVILYGIESIKIFSYFCLIINTLGSVGDLWIAVKLTRHERGTMIQDTKTGIELWEKEPGM